MELMTQVFFLVIGFVLLVKGADWFVEGAASIADKFGIPQIVIGLTIVAMGTSAPEAAVSISAALQDTAENNSAAIAIGNIVGSNIFNITLILGLSSQVMPLTSAGITIVDYMVMIAAAVIPMLFGLKGRIGRAGGFVMFISFVAYTYYLINAQIA